MSVAILVLLMLAVFAVSVRGGATRRGPKEGLGTAVRRFFQYGVQFALVCIVAVGLSMLLGQALQRETLVAGGRDALAQGLAFTLVGVPFLWLLGRWSARRMAEDPREAASLPWSWYLSLSELVPLAVTVVALQEVLLWAVRANEYQGSAIATTLVWGCAWAVHRRVTRLTTPPGQLRDHELAGAGFGLWTAAAGLASFIAAVLQTTWAMSGKDLLVGGANPVARAGVGLVVGLAVWIVYWIRLVHHSERTLHWHVYVMIVGVGAGLVAAIASASVALYDTLVWFIGNPGTDDAALHFRGSMSAAGVFVAGLLVWWYHRTVLREAAVAARDEAIRVYEYIVALIALVAAAIGVMILLVALIESITASAVIAGGGAGNTLLLAITLLVVGAPLWWWFWRAIGRATAANPETELVSPTRRVYLFLLFGAVGVAALIALLVAMYQLFSDLVAGALDAGTLRSMRWGIGVLLTAAAVASYHWQVYRGERSAAPEHRRRSVVLLGADDDVAHALRQRIGGRVEVWSRLDGDTTAWDVEALEAAVAAATGDDVLVLAEQGALRAIPIERD